MAARRKAKFAAKKRRAPKAKAAVEPEKPKPHPLKRVNVELFGPSERKLLLPKLDPVEMFKAAQPPPWVVPKGAPKLAMDEATPNGVAAWASSTFYSLAFAEGWTFLGYPYLSQLALIPEYRIPCEIIATEATRKWIEIQSTADRQDRQNGEVGDTKADKIKELTEELDRLGVREAFKLAIEQDGYFGRAHLFLDACDPDDRDELKTPIGDGGAATENKLDEKNPLKAVRPVEAVWCYPSRYDAIDPLKPTWYNPLSWFVNGKEVDASRLLLFVGRPVPDLLKPAFSFGGLSLIQMMKPYVDNWLQTRQSVNDLVSAFSTMVLSTSLDALLADGGALLDQRINLFSAIRSNRKVFAASKDNEDVKNVSAPLSGLDELQAQAQEHMAAVAQIPFVKLFGLTPSGLNATSDGEIRVFYDRIHALQESFCRPNLTIVFKMAQINIWGEVDPDIVFVFQPLMELSELDQANLRKVEAETDGILIDHGELDPQEGRQRLAFDPAQPYGVIDASKVPAPTEPEEGNIKERVDVGEGVNEEDAA